MTRSPGVGGKLDNNVRTQTRSYKDIYQRSGTAEHLLLLQWREIR
jgi:hypothetical protein